MTSNRQFRRVDGLAVDAWLEVRCRGRRIAVGFGPGEPMYLQSIGEPEHGWSLDREVLFAPEEDTSPPTRQWIEARVRCPHHRDGHVLDGARLRSIVTLRCRPGKRQSVDVADVSLPTP